MKKGSNKIWLMIAIAFMLVAAICGVWFFLYGYFVEPEIVLNGPEEVIIKPGEVYEDPGATATLEKEDVSNTITADSTVDNTKIGEYKIVYSVTNKKGKQEKSVVRIVKVYDDVKPVLKLKGSNPYTVQYGTTYKDPGYTATDNYDGDITNRVKTNGAVDTKRMGKYTLYYSVSDSSGNTSTVTRTINVTDTIGPTISLKGNKNTQIKVGGPYVESGYTATDNYDGDVTSNVKVSGSVNVNIAGYYTLTYSVKDSFGNSSTVNRSVQVGSQTDIDNANYIAVSISEQHLWYYKNGSLKVSTAVVTGHRGKHDTPRGTYRIYGKTAGTYLVGDDYKTWVNYWIPFSGGYGLHDADGWRSSYGGSIYTYNGSHGCVNMPYWAAEAIYYNATVGTLVKIY